MNCPGFAVTNYSAFDSAIKPLTKTLSMSINQGRMVSSYEFELYTEDCAGGVTIGSTRYNAKKGCFSLTKPGQLVKMHLPYKCYFFNIYTQDEALCEVLDSLPEFGVLWNMDEAVKVFHEMLSVGPKHKPSNQLQIQGCICRLLSMIVKARPLLQEDGEDSVLAHRKLLQQADRYIREHYMEDLSLATLAQQCNLHPNYFHRLYTTAFGQTPAQRILNRRIAAAKMLLLTENCTMSEIAARCGFSSQTYFGYKFKEIMGQTPLQYRKKQLGSHKP